MEIQTQFSVYLINKPGVLAAITGALADAKVNIVALALMDAGEHGALRFVCNQPEAARKTLAPMSDRWTEAEVLTIELDNRPGAFAAVAQKLASEHINISYAYCTGGAKGGKTTAVFKVSDMLKTQKVLQKMARKHDKADGETVKRAPGKRT